MRFAFYSTMTGMLWGGSEELWSQAAHVLLDRGHEVAVNYSRRKRPVPKLQVLERRGAQVHFRSRFRWGSSLRPTLERLRVADLSLKRWLRATAPDLVLLSSGYHTDDLSAAQCCHALGIPYAVLLQAASPYQWIKSSDRAAQSAAYAKAGRCYFVSQQNRDVIETNLALDLTNAAIVDNPFNVPADAAPAWPAAGEPWRLACVARLQFSSKGQDLLIQALRRPKWRDRPLEITLYGEDGGNRWHIEQLIALHGLQRHIKLGGFVDNVQDIWRRHHALVLPSRFEGNPLALIEAMLCGRMPIVTNVGRVAELVDDNASGFVAAAATVDLVDDAIERAWQRRHEWQTIGARAAQTIRARHSLKPAEDFANALLGATIGVRTGLSRAA